MGECYYVYYPLDENGIELSSTGMFENLDHCETFAKDEKNCIISRIEKKGILGWEFVKFVKPRFLNIQQNTNYRGDKK